jgi:uncharacterized membrane protein (UPF0127 family)
LAGAFVTGRRRTAPWWFAGLVVLAACAGGTGEVATDDGLVGSFGAVTVRVTSPDGDVCEACFWLADTGSRRAQGLMGVTDLQGAAGMVFVYDRPSTSRFWMRSTLLDLTVTFHDADGRFVGSQAMVPCPTDVADANCPSYGAPEPFVVAIEVPSGDEQTLGLVTGSRIEVLGDCVPGEGG